MPGIEFVASFNHDPFVKSANAILSSFRNMSAQVERMGGNMQHVMDGIFDGTNLGKGMQSFFDGVIENFGLSEKAAESFRQRAETAIRAIGSSSDDAGTKINKIVTAMAQLVSEAKQVDMSGLKDSGIGSQGLEDMRISVNFLIDSLNDATESAEALEEKVADRKGKGLEEKIKDIENYESALKDASDVANEAYKSQEEYIKMLEDELAKLTDKVNSSNDQSQIEKWNKEAEELTKDLTDAKDVLVQIGTIKSDLDIKIEGLEKPKETLFVYKDLKDELQEYKKVLGQVEFGTKEADKAFQDYANNTKSASNEIKDSLSKIAAIAGVAFGINEAANFVQKIAETREYFQDIESSMKVFLGSAEKSAVFTEKLKDYAWYNMFEFSDLAKASQQMIAYGQDVDSIIPRLDQLSNVAAGTHAGLLEMVDAYNRAKSTGVVDGMAMKSWAVKGVVIKDVLKEMGETAVGTTITFEQLNKVLDHITGEGGMFHNLMAEQLNNISAEKGQLEDNLASMYNEIGKKLQGAITKWYKIQSDMVDNYTDIAGGDGTVDFVVNVAESGMDLLMEHWKELMALIKNGIALYGSWRVALVATSAIQKAHAAVIAASNVATRMNNIAIAQNTTAKATNTTATVLLGNAIKALNASMLASPWTWAAASVAALTFMTYKLVTADDAETAARKRATAAIEEWEDKLEQRKERANSYIQTIKSENSTEYEKLEAWEALKKEMPSLTEAYDRNAIAQMDMGESAKKVKEEIEETDYEHAKQEVEKYRIALENAKKKQDEYLNSNTPDPTGTIVERLAAYYEAADEGYKSAYEKLRQIEELREKMAEQSKPIEIRVQEANENYTVQKNILDFYDKAMVLAKEVEEANGEMAMKYVEGTNMMVEDGRTNYQKARDDFDDFIKSIKKALDDPLKVKVGTERDKLQQLYNELVEMKKGWAGIFASPILIRFKTSFQNAKDAEESARTEIREGMHFVESLIGGEINGGKRGYWAPNEDQIKGFQETFKEVRSEFKKSKNDFDTFSKNAKKGLETFVAVVDDKLRVVKKGTKDARLATDDDFTKIKQSYEAASKAFKDRGGDTTGKAAQKAAKEAAARNAKRLQDQWKHEQEMTKLTTDAARAREDASIAAIQNQAERERKEREAQHRRTIKDLKSQEQDIYKAIYEQRKKAYETANNGKHYENTEEGKAGYLSAAAQEAMRKSFTDDEKKLYDTRQQVLKAELDKENAVYARYIQERYSQEAQAMLDYLKEYGSVQEKRYAIAREYDDKIAKEQNEWRKKSLKAEKGKALNAIDVEILRTEIDWTTMFDGIGGALEDEMKETIEKIEKYMRTDAFSALDAKDKAEFVRMRNELRSKTSAGVGTFDFSIYGQIAEDLKAYQDAVRNHKQALIAHTEAQQRVAETQKEVDEAEKKLKEAVTEEEKRRAEDNLKAKQAKLKLAQNISSGTAKQVQQATEQVNEKKGNVEDSSAKAQKALEDFGNALNQISNGTLKGFADGLINVIGAITGGNSKGLAGLGKVGGIIGAILSIIDALGDNPAKFVDQIFEKVAAVLQSVIEQIPQIIGSVVKGAGGIVGSIASGIGNLVAGIFGGGEDWSAYDAALDKWGGILDTWEENVRYERDLMEKAYGVKAIEASQKAVDAAQKAAQAAQAIYKGWSDSGAGLFSSSNNTKVNEAARWDLLYGYDKELFERIGGEYNLSSIYSFMDVFLSEIPESLRKQMEEEIKDFGMKGIASYTGNVNRLFELTWQELEELKNRAPQFWKSIDETAREYLENYIEAGKAAEESLNALNEKLTTTTKENVFSDFLSSLYDLADGAEDVTKDIADNWQKMVNRMVVNNLIAEDFQGDLKKWYESLADLQNRRSLGEIDDKEYQRQLNELKNLYNNYFNEAQGKVQMFTDLGIIKPIEEAAEEVAGLADDMSHSIKSAFSDLMGDPTQDIEEWGRNLRNSLIQQFIRAQLLGSEFEEWAKGIAERYNSAWEAYNGGGINDADLRGIMTYIDSEVDAYTEAISEKAKRLMEAFGYTPDTEELQTVFSGLRDTFLNTLTDIEGDAKAFRKNLEDIMVKDLIEKQVLDVPVTVNGMTFDDFNAYVTDWNERYSEAVKSGNQAAIDSLLDELVQVREQTIKAADELRERLKVDDTTFSAMTDSWVDTLTDMTKTGEDWAENIGKTMAEKIIKDMLVTNAIQPLLDGLQDAFNAAMSQRNNGLIDFNNVLSAVSPELERIKAAFPGLQQVAKNIMNAFGLDTLTTQGFSNLSSLFFSALTDMEGDAAKFGKSIGATMAEQMADEYINGKYGKQIDDANRRWREALEKGDTTALDSIRSELESLYKTMADDSALKQFVDNIKQAQTEADTTFTNLTDSLVSQLMDFNGTAEAWAENLGKTIAQKVIEQTVVGTMIQPLLDNLQSAVNNSFATFGNNYAAIMSDVSISDAVNALMANYPQIKDLIESIMSAFGVRRTVENPFSDLSNSMVSSLMDMNATAESFGREIGQTLVSQMITAIVEQRGFQDQLNTLGEQWAQALETGDVAAVERIKTQLVEIRQQMGEAVQPLLDSISDLERETDTTFSSMTESWVSALSDMSKTAEDWAQDVGRVMAEKIVSQMVAPKYIQPLLDEMQKTYDSISTTPGVTIAAAVESMTPYLERIKSVYAEIQPLVADIFGSFGIVADSIENSSNEVEYALQDMKSNFVSALMDMTNSTEDFSNDISKILAQTFIEKFVLGDRFDQQMKYWQQQYESIIGSGMSEDERKKQLRSLRDAIATAKEGYVNSAMAVQELLGLTAEDSQEATMNMADKMTYDQADELLGINLAQELTLEQILAAITGNTSGIVPYSFPLSPTDNDMQAAQMIVTIQGLTDLTRTSTENMLTQVAVANSHLQLIRDYSKTIRDEVVMHLASMDSKLTNLRNL